jgi:hypothetical protein
MAQVHSETRASGRMTAVMRSVTVHGARVLRVAVVEHGRIVEERILKKRVTVTVGESEKSTFVLPGAGARSFPLFEDSGGSYLLRVPERARGRVANADGTVELAGRRQPLALDDESRGKIVIGTSTILFQMVLAPPVMPRPQLPVAVIRGNTGADWTTTIIAALSFLLHFMAAGSLYSDWLDPVVDDGVTVSGLMESLSTLPAPPAVESEANASAAAPSSAATSRPSSQGSRRTGPGTSGGSSAAQADRQAALGRELEQIELGTLAALGGSGPATSGVLSGGELPTTALDDAAASEAGVSSGASLNFHGGGTLRPGQNGGNLADVGRRGTSVASNDTGKAVKVAPPKGTANVPPPVVGGGAVPNAGAIVARMRAGFRRCYNLGLVDHPDAQGSVRLSISVGPSGEVSGVSAAPSGNLPGSIVSCVRNRAAVATFDAPVGGSAVVNVPVSFVKLP